MTATSARGTLLGLLADRLLGEPPDAFHPVRAFGKTMNLVERALYRDGRLAGIVYLAIGATLAQASGGLVSSTAVASFLSIAGRQLCSVAREVEDCLTVGDLDEARARLPALVGRDPSRLDEKEITRAVVESVAENTVDAVVAPALWSAFAGARGAFVYRAVNTMDSMVGHRSQRYEHFGWSSAKLDDLLNWLPARLTALLVACVRPRQAPKIYRTVTTQARSHPSPNSGVAESAFAAALDLRLGGENRYGDRTETRPDLGTGRVPEPTDIGRAVSLSSDVGVALAAALLGATSISKSREQVRSRSRS